MIPVDTDAMISNFDSLAMTTAQDAALEIIKGITQNKRRVLIGKDAVVIDFVQRVIPTAYQRIVSTSAKIVFHCQLELTIRTRRNQNKKRDANR